MEKPNSLVCLYTGLAQDFVFQDDLRKPGWYLSGGFDPELPFLSREDGEAAFRRRLGHENAVAQPSCPYTGNPVEFREDRGLWWAVGDFFRPYAAWRRREELVYKASLRNGKTRSKVPGAVKIVVGDTRRQESDPREGLGGGDEVEIVRELVK